MSDAINSTVRQERDHVSPIAFYGAAAVLIVILASGWFFTWLIERQTPLHVGFRREAAPARTVPREIDAIDQTLFSAHLPSRGNWAEKRRRLSSYVWVDRDRRIAKIPIERAMQLIVERGDVR